MNLHEYQAKDLFARYGVTVPGGTVVRAVDEVDAAIEQLGGAAWVAKAQVHAGGRGKAGGVRMAQGREALREAVGVLLGGTLITHQTGPDGLPIHAVLIESLTDISRELYVSLLVDRTRRRVAVVASAAGGMDIEQVAAETPDRILTEYVHPAAGLQAWQGRRLGFALELDARQASAFAGLLGQLYRLLLDSDASLIEINPLVVTADGALLALDAKVNIDDNALYRQPELAAVRDATQEDPRESRAREHALNYIHLSGSVGCMVNGAGLAMATMDLIKLCGGEPANFLDVGGGATAARVTEAFKLILSDTRVKVVLVNIFGGIVRCDLIAEGILQAIREVDVSVPVVVRLEGTRAEEGRAMLAGSDMNVVAAAELADAAQKAVDLAGQGAAA
ncbi:ADP-forming succinate--CoA ligase subunit beta [Acidihalobacter ferrooxydans]|uniref:Succinate--CoA ligase [ADP-forming] subunit beta n=1 Tax=Acidihalobacter ferrooxydans TaxID=1765967 RepID=A0A1P8UJH9_9GAMM|nr:ADP-forming succinate--CoA ligase subunit beta [Acidihalobacter ferrooxydans]APZ43954.1 succinate--CoA ligase subunit beta [Acidihalobacter ferrooxydans]